MYSIIILLAAISAGSVLMAALKGRRYEEILPLSTSGLVLFLFLAGMVGKLKEGAMLAPFLAAGMYIAALVLVIRKKNFKQFLLNIFTPGAAVYMALLAVSLFALIGKKMDNWDEFSHWGDVVKAMWLYNDFSTNAELNLTFQSYPPAMSLFQYFFEKWETWTNYGDFSEWRLYFSYQAFAFSFLMPFTRGMRWKKPFVAICGFAVIFLTPSLFYSDFYSSIYIDPFLGFLFGAGLLMILFRRECDRYYTAFLCAVCSMLVLAKDAGMLFAIVLAAACTVDRCIAIFRVHEKKEWLKLRYALYVVLSVVIPKALWKYSMAKHEVEALFGTPYDLNAIWLAVIGKNETYQQEVWDKFWLTVYKTKVALGNIGVGLNYFALPLVFMILYVVIVKVKRQQRQERNINDIIAPSTAAVTVVVYTYGVVASYMCKFSEREALALASFQRYLNIVILGVWIFVVVSFIVLICESKVQDSSLALIAMVVLLIISPTNEINEYVTRVRTQESIETRASYDEVTDNILNCTEEGSKIWFISQEDDGYDYWVTRFAIRPWVLEANWSWSIGESFYDGDYLTKEYDAGRWISALVFYQYDYVALYKLNDYFYENFADAFEDPDSIAEGKIYKVDWDRRLLVAYE